MVERIVYVLNKILFTLEKLLWKQNDYENTINKSISIIGEDKDVAPENIQITITYDNPKGLPYIKTTYDKVLFEGADIIINDIKYSNNVIIINHNYIKTINIKKARGAA